MSFRDIVFFILQIVSIALIISICYLVHGITINLIFRIINFTSSFRRFLILFFTTIAIVLLTSWLWSFLNSPPPFKDFPLNKTQEVYLQIETANFKRLSDLDKEEQIKDWLMFTIASDKDFTPNRIIESLYDLPAINYHANNGDINCPHFEDYINLGSDSIVALVPKTSDLEKRNRDLSIIYYRYQKNRQYISKKIQIFLFEYELNMDGKSARLTHKEDRKYEIKEDGKYERVASGIILRSDRVLMESFFGEQALAGGTAQILPIGQIQHAPQISTEITTSAKGRINKLISKIIDHLLIRRISNKPSSNKFTSQNKSGKINKQNKLGKNIDFRYRIEITKKGYNFKDIQGIQHAIEFDDLVASHTVYISEKSKLFNSKFQFNIGTKQVTKISRTEHGIKINEKIDDIDIGDLDIKKIGNNAFSVGFQSKEMDKMNILLLEISKSQKPLQDFFASHPDIHSVYTDKKTGEFYIQLIKNGDKVMKNGDKVWKFTPGVNSHPDFKWIARISNSKNPGYFSRADSKVLKAPGIEQISKRDVKPLVVPAIKEYSLSQIDRALRNNNWQEAKNAIALAIQQVGKTPDLMVRNVLVEIRLKQLKHSQLIFNSNELTEIKNALKYRDYEPHFLNEISKRILGLNFKQTVKDNKFIYTQDSPGLNNIDPNPVIEKVLSNIAGIKSGKYRASKGSAGTVDLGNMQVKTHQQKSIGESNKSSQNQKISNESSSFYIFPRKKINHCNIQDDRFISRYPYLIMEVSDDRYFLYSYSQAN